MFDGFDLHTISVNSIYYSFSFRETIPLHYMDETDLVGLVPSRPPPPGTHALSQFRPSWKAALLLHRYFTNETCTDHTILVYVYKGKSLLKSPTRFWLYGARLGVLHIVGSFCCLGKIFASSNSTRIQIRVLDASG